ncbi:MAG: amidohydrolase family protein [Candidatus Caldarchaeum sp.]|nr:amidohydrolase family protein [Candidatus Caldarchaeum sp.]MCX8200961.1 amidohydrolase family protein [Candidatus Caldarchaeum sp.]MDW8435248.1 amidohydrolase family protein [Candidatus Caldarchaeum sp.]
MTDEADILIKKIHAVTLDDQRPVLKDVDIAVKGGVIDKIGVGIRCDAKTEIDGRRKIALPGLVDAHTHCFQIFLRGALSIKELNIHPIWLKVLIPFEAEMPFEEGRVSAQLACLNMIKKGITSFADAGGPYPETLAEIAYQAGLRARITGSTMDRGPENYRRTVEHNRNLRKKWRDGRVQGWYSIRQVLTSSDELISDTFKAAAKDGSGIHIHLNEEFSEIEHSLQRWGMRPIEYLYSKGFLGENVLAAHCAFLNDAEVEALARTATKVAHCPMINLAYMTFPKVPRLLQLGVDVGLGSDGGSYRGLDLFVDMNVAMAALTAYFGTPYYDFSVMSSTTLLKMAAYHGAKAIGESNLGILREGYKADIITVDRSQPHLTPLHDPSSLPLFATGSDVADVIIDGKMVMHSRKVLTIDEEKIMEDAEEIAPSSFERITKLVKK